MYVLVALLTLGPLILFVAGIKRIPVGAVGIVIWLGRRTGDVRQEGVPGSCR